MSNWAKSFVADLAAIQLPDVFNPYRQSCAEHDLPHAALIRQSNLETVLESHLSQGVNTFWLGRDFGYRGARRTGISLTDEGHLETASEVFGTGPLSRATRTAAISERTATVTWGQIRRLSIAPLLWNAFPLHPHEPNLPMTNRAHTSAERRTTYWALESLLAKFQPEHVIAIGNSAADALEDLGVDYIKVRHPSYGGQAEFIAGLEQIYGLPPQRAEQLELI